MATWPSGGPGSALGAQRVRQRTEFASTRKKKQKETASGTTTRPGLLAENRFEAANISWTKRQLLAVVTFFIGRFVQNPGRSCCLP
jgi:hypothetical protein